MDAIEKFNYLFRLLLLSPSYDLARRFAAGEKSKGFKKNLPEDFDDVLATYKRFGDVTNIHLFDWVHFKSMKSFSANARENVVMNLGSLHAASKELELHDINQRLNAFFKDLSSREDSPNYSVLLVNDEAGMPRLVKEFKSQFIWYQSKLLQLERKKYPPKLNELTLYKDRLHLSKLKAGVQLLEAKVKNPSLVNWQLGYQLQFSKTLTQRIENAKGVYADDEIQLTKVELGKVTYRALRKFERMAEHAARGRFPCDNPIEYLRFDYEAIGERLKAYEKWKKSATGKKTGAINRLIAKL